MQITCLGASGCVTGSCFLLDNGHKFLIDCGLFQGGKQMEALNRHQWGFNPREVKALFLTHAHIDHSGRIPKLVRDGFRGKIYATSATVELCKILLLDSAHIQEMEAEWQSRKNRRRGKADVEPLYSLADVKACLPMFQVIGTDEMVSLNEDFRICFRNAGHILGASVLEVWSGPSSAPCKVVFSGDLGQKGQLIVEDPHPIHEADALFVESTYGNRNHRSFEESKKELIEAILYSYARGEKVIIPAFAVERTQEILYILGDLFRRKAIPSMPVYLDSPLAISATAIFRKLKTYYDREATDILNEGHDPFDFHELILSHTTEESIAINQRHGPAIVIAGNGMCTAGRIKHHLKHNLWRPGSSLVFVGFQAEGTLGRKIIEGARSIKVFGENILVRTKVFTIGGFSAHADQSDLLEWIKHFRNASMRVYVIHGERIVSELFAGVVQERLGFESIVPVLGDRVVVTPSKVSVLVKAAEGPEWRSHITTLMHNAQVLQGLLDEDGQKLPPNLVSKLVLELMEMEKRLRGILLEAKEELKGHADS
jgi:metallo-beta-lactamase family protein